MKLAAKDNASGTTTANNTPVGSAGQPFSFGSSPLKKEVPDSKKGAIQRRMRKKKMEDTGKK